MGSKNSALGVEHIHNLINHVALPPQLPQSEEPDLPSINNDLLRLLQDVTQTFNNRSCAAWTSVSKMLSALDKTEQVKTLRDDLLSTLLTALNPGGKYYAQPSTTLTNAYQIALLYIFHYTTLLSWCCARIPRPLS